jgi:hypothetical protein
MANDTKPVPPSQYAIYKGIKGKNGVLQFDLRPFSPHLVEAEMSIKEQKKTAKGIVFVNAAKAIGENVYDYKNGIKFAMSETDLAEFIVGTNSLKEPTELLVDIYHQIEHGDVKLSKSLKVKQGNVDTKNRPTFMITLTETGSGDNKIVTVPASATEMFILRQLFTTAIPGVLGWL